MGNEELFINEEADAWFRRNVGCLNSNAAIENDHISKLFELYGINPGSICEVGASNGYRLGHFKKKWPQCDCLAIEPSQEAITDGQARFPGVRFQKATIAGLEVDRQYDLVIVNFVFHWVERGLLLRSIANIDALCKDGGFLVIGDFLPMNRFIKVRYHHSATEAYTYKQDYASVLLSTGTYEQVGLLTTVHGSKKSFDPDVDQDMNRAGIYLLKKNLDGIAIEQELS